MFFPVFRLWIKFKSAAWEIIYSSSCVPPCCEWVKCIKTAGAFGELFFCNFFIAVIKRNIFCSWNAFVALGCKYFYSNINSESSPFVCKTTKTKDTSFIFREKNDSKQYTSITGRK